MAAAVEVRELTCRACEIISADAKARELPTALLEGSDERERSRDLGMLVRTTRSIWFWCTTHLQDEEQDVNELDEPMLAVAEHPNDVVKHGAPEQERELFPANHSRETPRTLGESAASKASVPLSETGPPPSPPARTSQTGIWGGCTRVR